MCVCVFWLSGLVNIWASVLFAPSLCSATPVQHDSLIRTPKVNSWYRSGVLRRLSGFFSAFNFLSLCSVSKHSLCSPLWSCTGSVSFPLFFSSVVSKHLFKGSACLSLYVAWGDFFGLLIRHHRLFTLAREEILSPYTIHLHGNSACYCIFAFCNANNSCLNY